MDAKRTRNLPIRTRQKIQSMNIAVNVLATMFEMGDPHLGIISAVAEDEHENVPAIFDGNSGLYVNLLTGETSTLDARSFAITTETWYVPHIDTFILVMSDKRLAEIKRLDLIKLFGKDAITDLKIKLR